MKSAPTFLKRPCAACPFRTDVEPFLLKARITEIERSVVREQQDFTCHKTLDDDCEVTPDSKRCAGMAILCEKINRPTQMMRIDERFGFYDARQMDMDAPVFDSFAALRKAQLR